MKSFNVRIEIALKTLIDTAKVGTPLAPVPVVLGDDEEERPFPFLVVYADAARNMDVVPAELKNRETTVRLMLVHNARETTAEVHGERCRALIEMLENRTALFAAIEAQDIAPYAVDMESESDAKTKSEFANVLAYRVRGVDNPQP